MTAAVGRVSVKRARAELDTQAGGPGEFDMILSAGNRDRDGEIVRPDQWAQPLPAHIPINVGHTSDVSGIVGSGKPFIDRKGNLRVRGKFSGSELGQKVRRLVNEGHLRGVSVEFLRTKNANGRPVNELVGGAFVMVPANPEAVVLSSKAAGDGADGGEPVEPPVPTNEQLIQGMHDAAYELGAQCVSGAAKEQRTMNRATSQAVQTGDDESPIGQLQEIMNALEEADPEDVATLASQAIGLLEQLGGSASDDGDGDEGQDDELEAKATALRVRMKMLR